MYNNHGRSRLQYVIGKAYRSSTIWSIARATSTTRTIASQPKAQSSFANGLWRTGAITPALYLRGLALLR